MRTRITGAERNLRPGMILREKSLGGGYLCEQNCFALTIAVYSI
jgi:hypothetical protein